VGAVAATYELVEHGVLPGRRALDQLFGACSAATPREVSTVPGPSRSGTFFSKARNKRVGYTIAYPPGHAPGDQLPLGVFLHGFAGDHTSTFGSSGLALRPLDGHPPAPIALVSVDGGGLYWNAHPGDDPMAMIIDELIPMCRRLGLGRARGSIGAIGVSMGGYGALLLAEKHPALISAVAAISPAVWTTYDEAHSVNAGAFASAADFAADDLITHVSALRGLPVRIASGDADPFRPGVLALAKVLPRSATVVFAAGCHDGSFFASQELASIEFLSKHLRAS
jgi:pimeloyl-ACP methyl ester carboxylesterase